jgi:hypothetical protein
MQDFKKIFQGYCLAHNRAGARRTGGKEKGRQDAIGEDREGAGWEEEMGGRKEGCMEGGK